MKFVPFGIAALLALAGCQTEMTLEQAEAACARKGGLLTVIYTQSITASGIEEPVPSPGECNAPEDFDAGAPTQGTAAPPAG